RHRIQVRAFVQKLGAVGAVHTTRRSEDQALDAGALTRGQGQAGRFIIDGDGALGIEIARRIADDGGQRDHRARALHGAHQVALRTYVALNQLEVAVLPHFVEAVVAVYEGVEHAPPMPPCQQLAREVRPNVARPACHQNQVPHCVPPFRTRLHCRATATLPADILARSLPNVWALSRSLNAGTIRYSTPARSQTSTTSCAALSLKSDIQTKTA